MGNALLLLALPVLLIEALRIMPSLNAVRAAAREIAGSVRTVSGTVPPTMATLADVDAALGQLPPALAGLEPTVDDINGSLARAALS